MLIIFRLNVIRLSAVVLSVTAPWAQMLIHLSSQAQMMIVAQKFIFPAKVLKNISSLSRHFKQHPLI
jgi:hypothetical protein